MRGTQCLYMYLTGEDFHSSPSLMSGHTAQHPAMIGLSPLQQAEVVLTGYRDCAAEALRYLVEVERFAEDDPIVVGLQKHLYEQQRALNVQRILSNLENNPDYLSGEDNFDPDDSGIEDQNLGLDYNHVGVEEQGQSETWLDSQQSDINHVITPEVDRDAIVSLAEEILSLIELEQSPTIGEEEMDDEGDEEMSDISH
ncbi:uncharacterized protein LOC133185780 isoform X2 [Saccostrea echinata]|uniref:uncharacterized protein LOC133176310 isoform X2 n=1 Tax=Saccostrea echinata TaxID=191078 RepID=UPI002A819458|nr:uncharacterized protein LOC133176310 isoform X2 [Saccostrea echinata]XP_061177057.1 uncharacterized protein LOC133185780 isoform X2 [Saccostrea echinata]